MLSFKPLLAMALSLSTVAAAAADAPMKQLDLVVPFAAGGLADVLARSVAEKLHAAKVAETVIVENRVGAGGNIGGDFVYRSKADGSTLLVSSPGPIAINQGLYSKMAFDPTRWIPVAILASVPNALIVGPSVSAKTATEFVAYAKAHPKELSYASQGNGTTSHLTAKLFESVSGTDMVHVPYKGDAPALTDLAGGQVQVFFGSVGAALPLHNAGKIRILAVADSHRSSVLPNVPSFAELGLDRMQSVTWYAMVAPPDTPAAKVRALNAAVLSVLDQPDIKKRLAELGLEADHRNAEQAQAFVKSETARWQKVIKDAKVSID